MAKPVKLKKINQSQFHMWRTVFAMVHADGVITDNEIHFMAEAMEDIPFNDEQKSVLNGDIKTPKDIVEMFKGIEDAMDQAKFFKFARDLIWVDGKLGKPEQDMILKLQKVHLQNVSVDDLVGKVELEFDEGETPKPIPLKDAKGIVHSFREHFLMNRFNAGK